MVQLDPSGKFLYVVCSTAAAISQYSIAPNGSLSALTPGTVTTGAGPHALAVSPIGNYVYVANKSDNTVSAFQFDGTTGLLTALPGSPFAVTSGITAAHAVSVSPNGKFLIVTGDTSGNAAIFAIASSGGLTSAGAPIAVGANPRSATFIELSRQE